MDGEINAGVFESYRIDGHFEATHELISDPIARYHIVHFRLSVSDLDML